MDYSALSKQMLGRSELFLRKHGPTILTAAGIAGFTATSYLTGKAVLKAQEPAKELKLKISEISAKEIDENYTKKDQAKEAGQVWLRDSARMARIFAPALVTGSISIICIVSAHGMMQKRQASLVAAYVALDEGFKAYRRRIVAELGEEREFQLYNGVKVLERAEGADPGLPCEIDRDERMPSPYARFFDEFNSCWSKTPEWNLMWLRGQQQMANDRLHARGFLFLNEVYEALGLPWSQAGQVVGWKLKEGGDNYVDFGMWDHNDEIGRAFVNGIEPSILLDFNVDGPIAI